MKCLIKLFSRLVSIHYLKLALLFPLFISGTFRKAEAQTVSLEQAISAALQNNRNLKIAEADIAIAAEKKKEAAGNFLPKLNVNADYRYYTDLPYQLMPASVFGGPPGTYKEVQFGVPQNLSANIQLSVPVINPVAINNLSTLDIARDIAELHYAMTEEDVVLNVSQTYYHAQILLGQLAFIDTNIINTEKLEKSVLLLNEQDLAKKTDVERVRLQLDQLSDKRSAIYTQYRQVTNALEFLMGTAISDSLEVEPVSYLIKEKDFDPQPLRELELLETKLRMKESELRSLKLSRLPSIGAYSVYGTTGFGNTGANSFFDFYPISFTGVQLSFPLFNGTVINHRIKQKKIETSVTRYQHELASDRNNMERVNALRQYETAEEQINTSGSQIELAKKIYSNTVLQNHEGIATLSDVLMADTSLREAQQNYTTSLISLFRAELELRRVTGNLIKR